MKHRPQQILDAAIELLASDGVGVSTSRIAKAAGVSNGTLFNYFPTKQDLLDAVYLHIKGGIGIALESVDVDAPLREATRSTWDHWLSWAKTHPEHHHVGRLLHEAGLISPQAIEAAASAFRVPLAVLQRLIDSDEVVDLPADYVGQLLQTQLELAVQADLDPVASSVAFEAMWNGLHASPRAWATGSGPREQRTITTGATS